MIKTNQKYKFEQFVKKPSKMISVGKIHFPSVTFCPDPDFSNFDEINLNETDKNSSLLVIFNDDMTVNLVKINYFEGTINSTCC